MYSIANENGDAGERRVWERHIVRPASGYDRFPIRLRTSVVVGFDASHSTCGSLQIQRRGVVWINLHQNATFP